MGLPNTPAPQFPLQDSFPFTTQLPAGLRPWEVCHPPRLWGRLPPASYKRRPGSEAWAVAVGTASGAGRPWAGELLSQRASGLGSGCCSFQVGGNEGSRGSAGLLCVSTNWRWPHVQGKFRCQMPLLEAHFKCLGIEQPQRQAGLGSFPAEVTLDQLPPRPPPAGEHLCPHTSVSMPPPRRSLGNFL